MFYVIPDAGTSAVVVEDKAAALALGKKQRPSTVRLNGLQGKLVRRYPPKATTLKQRFCPTEGCARYVDLRAPVDAHCDRCTAIMAALDAKEE